MAEKKQTAFTAKIVWFLVIAFLVFTIVSQLIIRFYNPFVTETAGLYTFDDYIQSTGIFIREERVVTYSGDGIVSYIYSDGEKLAKNSVIAEIYSSENDLSLQLRINELTEQIEVLRDAEKLVGSDNSQLEAFSNQIRENHAKMLQYIANGDYGAAADIKNDYLNLQSKRQIVNGTNADYSLKISQLESQIASLSSQISSPPTNLSLGETGYFVSDTDGYESVLTYDSIDDLNEEKIQEIIKNPNIGSSSNAIGKIVSDYKWKMVCIVPSQDSFDIYTDAYIDVRIGSEASITTAHVEKVIESSEKNKILVLGFDLFNSSLAGLRTAQIKIMFDEYEGIRISSEAVHFNDDEQEGVYIKEGTNVSFKLIDVIRTEGDYTLLKNTTGQSGYLSLYDTVIVKGEDLYDGKIIFQ